MTNEEIAEWQRDERAFLATPIGAAFRQFKNKLGRAWQMDSQERVSDRRLREVWDDARAAETEFRTLLDAAIRALPLPSEEPK